MIFITAGERLRTLRKGKGLTLTEVAEAAGCTASLISQAERGKANPSLSTLRNICRALDIPLFALFDDGKFKELLSSGTVTPKEKRVSVNRGLGWDLSLLNPFSNRKFDLALMEADVGENSGALNAHQGNEGIYVIQGVMEVDLDGQTFLVSPGDCIYFDCTKPHRWRSVGEEKLIAITAITPPFML